MNPTWDSGQQPDPVRIGGMGWVRVAGRGAILAVLVFGCFLALLVLRLIERPVFGERRPLTPGLVTFVCRNAFRVLGMGFVMHGTPMRGEGAVVANHSSWLDIFSLNATQRIYFVAKSEVAGWPGIGWLAQGTGTVFIARQRRHARAQTELFAQRLGFGHRLLFFPEGTSTDGLRVLAFKTTLFEPFFGDELRDEMQVQPVSVIYHAPKGEPARFYGWWGDMGFGEHLVKTLAARRQGRVELVYHPPLRVRDFTDRKALAAACETAVRTGHDEYSGRGSGQDL